jgi:gamma-glutamyltranspeptidase
VADYFYRGPIAREIDAWSGEKGGLLRCPDLATHVTRVEEAVVVEYRGHTIVKCGPWTQGPMLPQTLRLPETFDLKTMGHNRPDYVHAVVEALKRGLPAAAGSRASTGATARVSALPGLSNHPMASGLVTVCGLTFCPSYVCPGTRY